MPITIGGVECTELVGSGRMRFNMGEITATRLFKVPGRDAIAVAQALIGIDVGQGGVIIPGRPAAYPDLPAMIVRGVSVEEFDSKTKLLAPDDMIRYEWVKVIAEYSTKGSGAGLDNNGQTEEAWDFAGEYATVPTQGLLLDNPALGPVRAAPEALALGKLMPQAQYNFSRRRMVELDMPLIYARLGKVNSTEFLEADPEKVLFLGGRATPAFDGSGSRRWDVEFRFAVRSESWNKTFIPDLNGYVTLYTSGGAEVVVYEQIDLRPLLEES